MTPQTNPLYRKFLNAPSDVAAPVTRPPRSA